MVALLIAALIVCHGAYGPAHELAASAHLSPEHSSPQNWHGMQQELGTTYDRESSGFPVQGSSYYAVMLGLLSALALVLWAREKSLLKTVQIPIRYVSGVLVSMLQPPPGMAGAALLQVFRL